MPGDGYSLLPSLLDFQLQVTGLTFAYRQLASDTRAFIIEFFQPSDYLLLPLPLFSHVLFDCLFLSLPSPMPILCSLIEFEVGVVTQLVTLVATPLKEDFHVGNGAFVPTSLHCQVFLIILDNLGSLLFLAQ